MSQGDTEPRKVAIILNRDKAYAQNIRRGIVQFSQTSTHWFFHTSPQLSAGDLARFRNWRPDGIIAEALNSETARAIEEMHAATIDVSSAPMINTPWYVGVDHVQVGEMAASHFLDRGLRHFAYFGNRSTLSSLQYAGFSRGLRNAGHSCTTLMSEDLPQVADEWEPADRALLAWLSALPRPTGLLLYDDNAAMWLLQPCHEAGLRVPEDIAILGVNDDENNCLFAVPPVSSIAVPGVRVGYEAARILHMLINQQESAPRPQKLFLPPTEVTLRQSTDLLAIEDHTVAEAIRWVRAHADKQVNVARMVRELNISRRLLERRFKKNLNRTLAQEIRMAHAERARQLLAGTLLSLRNVAAQSGHRDVQHLSHNFRQHIGMTPAAYRRNTRQ